METKTGNEEIEMLKEDIARLREDIARLASAVLGDAGEAVDEATAEARETFTDKVNERLDQGREFLDNIDEQVSRHPIGSILAAFGVGLLIAKILGPGGRA